MQIANSDFSTLLVSETNHILSISLNRPEKKNAINAVMTNELLYLLDYAKQSSSIRVIELSACGDVFCAGGDLRSMSGESESNVPDMKGSLADIAIKLNELCKPVVTRIEGNVYAGALLLVCNSTHAYALDSVTFCAPEIKRGIWPFMVMAGLFRVVSKRDGLDLIMRGEPIDAQEAARIGLVNAALNSVALKEKTTKVISDLAKLPPKTMTRGLQAFNQQEAMSFSEAIKFLEKEIQYTLTSDEAKEGISAFLEKRDPNWD